MGFTECQFGLERVPLDIAGDCDEVIPVANDSIEVVALPEGFPSAQDTVDAGGTKAFPGGDDGGEIGFLVGREQEMNVIRHDNERMQKVTLLVEVLKVFRDDGGNVRDGE